MDILIGFLTIVLVVDALLLILLVLLQLPKKDAGAGVAFGGGTTDALFGPGAGNILTQITKYTAGIFMGLSLFLSVLIINQNEAQNMAIENEIQKQQQKGLAPVDVNSEQESGSQSSSGASDAAPTSVDPAQAESGSDGGSSAPSAGEESSDASQGNGSNAPSQGDSGESSDSSLESGSSSSGETSSDSSSEQSDSP